MGGESIKCLREHPNDANFSFRGGGYTGEVVGRRVYVKFTCWLGLLCTFRLVRADIAEAP